MQYAPLDGGWVINQRTITSEQRTITPNPDEKADASAKSNK